MNKQDCLCGQDYAFSFFEKEKKFNLTHNKTILIICNFRGKPNPTN